MLFSVSVALAQPPAETCGAGDSLSGADMLPQTLVATPAANSFTMSGAGCNELGFDHVTCLTPTTDCTIVAECFDPDALTDEVEGLQFSISVFSGACSTAPASCLDSSQGTAASGQISVAVTGGTNYCFVCERADSNAMTLEMSTAGSCGALPVELQTFDVGE
jgi:hypothetical protein